ncbi:hypothetical protein QAD02_014216 [Eretmocerus hayati]|uniref:Uncharacterized protein n=1 Tax=Eretmocerus hayati TaxID=131215 RepID=A0ACC2P4A2_9HYME|nr:hypothetical protein QAD02_014216 [Eretmocerus hayati]
MNVDIFGRASSESETRVGVFNQSIFSSLKSSLLMSYSELLEKCEDFEREFEKIRALSSKVLDRVEEIDKRNSDRINSVSIGIGETESSLERVEKRIRERDREIDARLDSFISNFSIIQALIQEVIKDGKQSNLANDEKLSSSLVKIEQVQQTLNALKTEVDGVKKEQIDISRIVFSLTQQVKSLTEKELVEIKSNIRNIGGIPSSLEEKLREVVNTNPTTYQLQDYYGKNVEGGFYEQELSTVKNPNVYLVEKILQRKGAQVLVKWLGLDEQDSWISKNNVL